MAYNIKDIRMSQGLPQSDIVLFTSPNIHLNHSMKSSTINFQIKYVYMCLSTLNKSVVKFAEAYLHLDVILPFDVDVEKN